MILWGVLMMADTLLGAAPDSPSASIPPLSRFVVLDGRLGGKEWHDAAVIPFTAVDDHAELVPDDPVPGPVITTCRLKYDEEALWVGWFCREQVDGYPQAYPRGPMDDPTQDDATTTYYPYWQAGPHVRLEAGRSLVSYYLKPDQALVIVSNLSYEGDSIELDLSRLLPDRSINVTEMLTDRVADLEDRCFRTVLEGYHCLALKVTAGQEPPAPDSKPPPDIPAPPPFTLEGHDSRLWHTNADGPSVTADETTELGEGVTGLKLTSKLYRAMATATLKNYRLGRNGTVALRVRMDARFRLAIGPMEFHHYTTWKMLGPIAGWNQGTVYQVPVDSDTTYLLVVTLRDGYVDATLGDRGLVRDMAFDFPAAGNEVKIRTWAGNQVTFALEQISTKPRQLYRPQIAHPVR